MSRNKYIIALFYVIFTNVFVIQNLSAKGNNSAFFKDVVFQEGGDFLSLLIGESKAEVMSKLPSSALVDEDESYLYYSWELGKHEYIIDLYFSESDNLVSIDGQVFFYDKQGKASKSEAELLYMDMRSYFVAKYDETDEEKYEGSKYTYWYLENLDVEVGITEGQVYWYLYDFSYDDYGYGDSEATPVSLEDVGLEASGLFMGVDLLDSRAKVKSILEADNFSYAGLNTLEYSWDIGANYYYVNYTFDENDLLKLMDVQLDFAYSYDYDEMENSYASIFYEDMKKFFNDKYGIRKEKILQGEEKVISWRFMGKEFVLGLSYDNVHWYYSKDE